MFFNVCAIYESNNMNIKYNIMVVNVVQYVLCLWWESFTTHTHISIEFLDMLDKKGYDVRCLVKH